MKPKLDPKQMWTEYQKGIDYKEQIGLFDDVKFNRDFYQGKQWEGVNAPNIEKPVINIFRPAIDYFVSMLVSDDIGVTLDFPEDTDDVVKRAIESIVRDEINKVFEHTKFKHKFRKFIKNAALDGDAYFHFWYDPDKRYGKQKGAICAELIMNVNVIFGNPAESEIEPQPYMIIATKLPTDMVKKMVPEKDRDNIKPDNEDYTELELDAIASENYTTVLTRFWKDEETETVWFAKSVREFIIKDATDTKSRYYPIAKANWMDVPYSCHGYSTLTSVRQNQISINKFYMMINEFMKKLAFPKIVYDKQKISSWTNRVEAIGVDGDPTQAFVSATPVISLPPNVKDYVLDLIEKTKQTLGVYDVALGNARPENTSAIIALQKTAAQPLELQRLDLYQMVEDSVRIIVDLMAAFYGKRPVSFKIEEGQGQLNGEVPEQAFDFADLRDAFTYTVDVGQAAYWAETTQIQTLDNLYQAKIIPDPITYLEQLPDGVVKNKGDIIMAVKRFQQQAMAAQQFDASIQAQMPALDQLPQ